MDMKKHLPSADLEKLGKILEIKEAYQRGDISLEEGRTRIREQIGKIRPYEIALAEQELKTIEENECRKEDIQKMIELFDEVMDTNRPNLPLNHPIMCYYRENDEMRRHMLAIEDLVQYPIIKNQWLELYDQIAAFRTHLSRKQNQLYSILEQKGFDRDVYKRQVQACDAHLPTTSIARSISIWKSLSRPVTVSVTLP